MIHKNIHTVRSANRIPGASVSNNPCQVSFPHNEVFNTIEILNAIIPNTSYAINSYNNTFIITVGATNYNVIVPFGTYSSYDFVTMLMSLLNNLGTGLTFTVVIGSYNNLLTISATGTFTINPSIMSRILGILTTSSGTSITGTQVVQLNPPKSYLITIGEIQSTNQDFIILNNVTAGSIKFFEKNQDYTLIQYYANDVNLKTLTITITDENGYPVNFNGVDWTITFNLYKC